MTQLFRELDYSEEHSSVLISLGLHFKLLQAIRSHTEDEGIQCSALRALMRLGTRTTTNILLFSTCSPVVLCREPQVGMQH